MLSSGPYKFTAACLIFVLVSGCASSEKKDRTSSSVSSKPGREATEEIAIGEQIHNQILSSFYPYTEPALVGYINEVGASLAKHAERKDLPYKFTILYSDKIYATSAPGGYVYLTTGLLVFLKNEAELAAILAHEIGELQYHDPHLSRSRQILEAITKTGSMVGPAFGEIGALAVLGLAVVSTMAEKSVLSPAQRLVIADAKALGYMTDAGYDPQGMIDLFYEFLNARDLASFFYDYYQSRPITEERFASLRKEFARLPLEGKSFETHYETYQERIQGVREIYKR